MKQLLFLATFVLVFATGGFAQTKKPTTTTNNKTVVEIAANSPDHSTLVSAVKAAGLTETLRGKGPFTIFAPTNKAFEKMMTDQNQMRSTQPMMTDTMQQDNMRTWQDTSNMTTRTTPPMQRDSNTWNQTNRNTMRDTMNRSNQPTQRDSNTWNQTNRNTMRDTMNRSNQQTQRDSSTWNQDNRSTMQDTAMNRSNQQTQRNTDTWNQTNPTTTRRDTVPPITNRTMQTQAGRDTVTNTWLQPENRAALTEILNYHVVRGTYDSNALKQAIKAGNGKAELTTVNGAKLIATLQGNSIYIEDVAGNKAKVSTADLRGSNGVIHVIDQVVMPTDEDDKK